MGADGRTRHYGHFYGLDPVRIDSPLWLVHGNCQAEALRVLLAGSGEIVTVRIPPVHELTAEDVPHLDALLTRTQVLLSQPVRAGYRDLPLGTDDVSARLPVGARVLRWPVTRYAGLHPYQVIVRNARDRSSSPPMVPYHDLRTVAVALGGPDAWAHEADAAAVRAVAEASVAELARREQAQCDVGVADVFAPPAVDLAHTINHVGNRVLAALAARLQEAGGITAAVADPGRDLLGGIRAPLQAHVLDALGLDAAPREHWTTGDGELDPDDVHAAQLAAYRADPGWTDAAVARHGERMELLGLAG